MKDNKEEKNNSSSETNSKIKKEIEKIKQEAKNKLEEIKKKVHTVPSIDTHKAKERLVEGFENLKDQVETVIEDTTDYIHEYPGLFVTVSFILGFLIGFVIAKNRGKNG